MTLSQIPHGYLDRWTARPGERIALHVAADTEYELHMVRVYQCFEAEHAPELREVVAEWFARRSLTASPQRTFPGSFAYSDPLPELAAWERLELELLFLPTSTARRGVQTVVALAAEDGTPLLALGLDAANVATLHLGTSARPRSSPGPLLVADRWYRAVVVLERGGRRCSLSVESALPAGPGRLSRQVDLALSTAELDALGSMRRLLLATAALPTATGWPPPGGCFNGKIEAPELRIVPVGTGGDRGADKRIQHVWRLAPCRVHDGLLVEEGGGALLHVVNAPTDAVTGHSWDGSVLDFRDAPDQYGALLFHDDDLEDACWPEAVSIELPPSLPSGVYSLVLAGRDGERRVPLFVAPRRGAPRAEIAVLMPTFTYLAYANEHVREEVEDFLTVPSYPSRQDLEIALHRDFGLSLYDRHADGSGVCYSSMRRPIINLDPTYRFWLFGGPVHLGEDLFLLDWLDRLGRPCDVLTDHLVAEEGAEALAGYRVVLTGSHPEYASAQLLDALTSFVESGGRLMYLGGNGHYWVCSTCPQRPHLMEIRRGHNGGRTWESRPGEEHHSTTGEPGGLWRYRGRPPNRLLGVGFSAQGADDRAPGYRRVLPTSGTGWEWVFDGLLDEGAIGEVGLLLGGAAGNEIDRADAARGSPSETVLLATSKGHSDAYQLAIEDLLLTAPSQGGREQPLVRSDVVVVPYQSGGCVFSVGAITWLGALAYDSYDNDVARLTRNVLERFLEPSPLPGYEPGSAAP